MSSTSDPFGFETPKPGFSPSPIIITVRPGQEIHILVADESGTLPRALTDRDSPSPSPDRDSPSPSPDRGR